MVSRLHLFIITALSLLLTSVILIMYTQQREDEFVEHQLAIQKAMVEGAARDIGRQLEEQIRQIVAGDPVTVEKFQYQLAFNLIPHVDVFKENGYTGEEMKMYNESRKIMHSDIQVSSTCNNLTNLFLQLCHGSSTGAAGSLVGGSMYPFDGRQIVDGLQTYHHLYGGAIWIGHNVPGKVMQVLRIDLRNHQGYILLHAEG